MNKMLLLFSLLDVFGRYWGEGPRRKRVKAARPAEGTAETRSRAEHLPQAQVCAQVYQSRTQPHTQRTPLGLFENQQAHILVELLNLRGWA